MKEKNEWTEDERNEHFQMIKHKLKSKTIKNKLETHISAIQKIFECPISISLVFDNDDKYTSEVTNREVFGKKRMLLSDFIEFLNSEDKSLYVNIDPIYLNNGINEIKNILLTSIDDKLIIVPQIN